MRERDVIIATKVLGLSDQIDDMPAPCPDGREGCLVMHYDLFFANGQPLPKYWTDDAASLIVLNKLADDGHVVLVKADGLRTYEGALRWTILADKLQRIDTKTMSEGICIAACKLKGIDYERLLEEV